jgi:transposase
MDSTTEPTTAGAAVFVGIDVSKTRLDVALRPGAESWGNTNDEAGVAELVDRLRPLAGGGGPELIVLEATGGLERLVVAAVALAGLPVAVENPRKVR